MKKKTKETVSINFEMKKECNALLTSTIVETGRSKRQEAALRLHDHLKRYPKQVWEAKE
ncbi:TraY domain-containing protein [Moritella sp.]|uniref:TraY domain-containing protein n=1 Tax=Moritella sp. TaxID=78556 RepID=UPI0025D344DB|nr:TraY domain-containing protein [Moritella sp.]MCJ8352300.1 TraY domain-containing protein [Moritella sp.]